MKARRWLVAGLAGGALWAAAPGVAQAHPLGNFTVNHYDHVHLLPGRVEVTSVLDRAEIPTAQRLQTLAPDGSPTAAQLAAAAVDECADVSAAVVVTVDGASLAWTVRDTAMETVPGAGGLPTLRLTCRFDAEAALDVPTEVAVRDTLLPDRVGWREMTADGHGVRLVDSPVPVTSVSDELRRYPVDLLASPVDVRSFTVATEPGQNSGAGATITPGSGDPFTNAVAGLDRRLADLIGDRALTPMVGTLAVLLAVLLGCGHALLPGHGKTVMAAYLAARRGRGRDALVVGATVTATHTVGVLVLGLAISLSSTLAGDQVIRWLGVGSGLLVAGIGAFMLRAALRRRTARRRRRSARQRPSPSLAGGGARRRHRPPRPRPSRPRHDHEHPHDHDHDHGHGRLVARPRPRPRPRRRPGRPDRHGRGGRPRAQPVGADRPARLDRAGPHRVRRRPRACLRAGHGGDPDRRGTAAGQAARSPGPTRGGRPRGDGGSPGSRSPCPC